MYQKLLDMYVGGKINEDYLNKAVKIGWINEQEKLEIIEFDLLARRNNENNR